MTVMDTRKLIMIEKVMAMAISRNSWPASSRMKITGRKTATVVAVEANTAPQISLVPSRAAWYAFLPSFRWRSIFSNTTMELSTSMPTAKEIPARLTTLKLRLLSHRKMKQPMTEIGIASAVVSVDLTLRRKVISTVMASMPPIRTFCFTRLMAVMIYGLSS